MMNLFYTLQETSERYNDKYENFVTARIAAAAAACLQTKPKAKCRVTWESKIARKEWDNVKKIILTHQKKPNEGQRTET